MKKRTVLMLIQALAVFMILGGCMRGPLDPTQDPVEKVDTAPDARIFSLPKGDTVVEGTTSSGALYTLACPARWNGRLVLYAHGFVSTDRPIRRPEEAEQFRDLFLSQGFAIAYSSYSENGWAVENGAACTRQLYGLFSRRFLPPLRVYLVGASMGGLISTMLMEKYPVSFDGALVLCGPIGGAKMEMQYILDVLLLWNVFFPGVTGPSALRFHPSFTNFDQISHAIASAIMADLTTTVPPAVPKIIRMAAVDQLNIPYDPAHPEELIPPIVTAFGFYYYGYGEIPDRMQGDYPVGTNTYTVGGIADSSLNAAVEKITADPVAAKYVKQWYQPTGKLLKPIISLHTTRDPAVPIAHQRAYAGLLRPLFATNFAAMTFDAPGHCEVLTFDPQSLTFTSDKMPFVSRAMTAFSALVKWVELKIHP